MDCPQMLREQNDGIENQMSKKHRQDSLLPFAVMKAKGD